MEKEEWIDAVLNSTDGVILAKPPTAIDAEKLLWVNEVLRTTAGMSRASQPLITNRVQATTSSHHIQPVSNRMIYAMAASILLLLVLNLTMILTHNSATENIAKISVAQEISNDLYSLQNSYNF